MNREKATLSSVMANAGGADEPLGDDSEITLNADQKDVNAQPVGNQIQPAEQTVNEDKGEAAATRPATVDAPQVDINTPQKTLDAEAPKAKIDPAPPTESQVQGIVNKVQQLTVTYDPVKAGEEVKEFEGEQMGFFDLVFRYASSKEKMMWFWATICSVLFGGALPSFCLIFGDMINDVGTGNFDMLKDSAKAMSIIGVVATICSFSFIALYSVFAVEIAAKIQVEYFKAALTKDAAYYDEHNTNQISAKISKECQAIQRGAGDKTGLIIFGVASFFCGFAISFYMGWFMTSLLIVILPLMAVCGSLFAIVLSGTMKE